MFKNLFSISSTSNTKKKQEHIFFDLDKNILTTFEEEIKKEREKYKKWANENRLEYELRDEIETEHYLDINKHICNIKKENIIDNNGCINKINAYSLDNFINAFFQIYISKIKRKNLNDILKYIRNAESCFLKKLFYKKLSWSESWGFILHIKTQREQRKNHIATFMDKFRLLAILTAAYQDKNERMEAILKDFEKYQALQWNKEYTAKKTRHFFINDINKKLAGYIIKSGNINAILVLLKFGPPSFSWVKKNDTQIKAILLISIKDFSNKVINILKNKQTTKEAIIESLLKHLDVIKTMLEPCKNEKLIPANILYELAKKCKTFIDQTKSPKFPDKIKTIIQQLIDILTSNVYIFAKLLSIDSTWETTIKRWVKTYDHKLILSLDKYLKNAKTLVLLFELGETCHKQAKTAFNNQNYKIALQFIKTACKNDQNNSDYKKLQSIIQKKISVQKKFSKANMELKNKNYKLALKYIKIACKNDPTNVIYKDSKSIIEDKILIKKFARNTLKQFKYWNIRTIVKQLKKQGGKHCKQSQFVTDNITIVVVFHDFFYASNYNSKGHHLKFHMLKFKLNNNSRPYSSMLFANFWVRSKELQKIFPSWKCYTPENEKHMHSNVEINTFYPASNFWKNQKAQEKFIALWLQFEDILEKKMQENKDLKLILLSDKNQNQHSHRIRGTKFLTIRAETLFDKDGNIPKSRKIQKNELKKYFDSHEKIIEKSPNKKTWYTCSHNSFVQANFAYISKTHDFKDLSNKTIWVKKKIEIFERNVEKVKQMRLNKPSEESRQFWYKL
ncbi:MAG: hypothetical protein PVI75_07685 [Gammaproteobacteria bacterium]